MKKRKNKYPITPEYLTEVPDPIVDIYDALNERIIEELCKHLNERGSIASTDAELIRILQRRGLIYENILNLIQETNKIGNEAFKKMLEKVAYDNQVYYTEVITAADVLHTNYQQEALEQEIGIVSQQMQDYFGTITGSLGFAVKDAGTVRVMDVGMTYQKVLNDAVMDINSGFKTAENAIHDAVKRLADSGLQWVDYPSGHHNRIDVAVRRAVQTGASKISAQYADHYIRELDTPYIEVSAHQGARDKDGKTPWANHKKWQGRVYSVDMQKGKKYPSAYAICEIGQVYCPGLGKVDGLTGVNCRHLYYPFVEGVSERAYTDEELEHIDPEPFTYQGKKYTLYDATQKQRQLETEMRRLKRLMIGEKASGEMDRYNVTSARLKRIEEQYRRFSEYADLPTQFERAEVEGFEKAG